MTNGLNYDELELPFYRNTRNVFANLNVSDLARAAILAPLNLMLVGDTGTGKTQLATDVYNHYFGKNFVENGKGIFVRAHPEVDIYNEIFTKLNLDKAQREVTDNIGALVYYVDELNRCPPIVQNYFFDFFDGKIIYDGKIMPLGKEGYTLGFATGNLGDGAYVGITDSDRALKDRMHLIVNLDYPDFTTTETDDSEIYSSKKDPRASLPKKSDDLSEDLVQLNKEFRTREAPFTLSLLGIYFNKGLDYLENTKKHSKRAVVSKWPNVQGIRKDTDESKIFPLSKRSIFGAISISQALEMIAESEGKKIENSVPLFLDSLRLTVPYSGVIARDFVHNEHDSDAYAAFDAIMEKNISEIKDRLPQLEEAILLAEAGIKSKSLLDEIAKSEGKWFPIRKAISDYADKRKENPSEEGIKLSDVINRAKSKTD